jgi:hypothetical protein
MVPEISKSVQRSRKSQKKDKNIYETINGSSRVSRGRTIIYETFLKFRKKNAKPLEYRIKPWWFNTKLLGFNTKLSGFNTKLLGFKRDFARGSPKFIGTVRR